MEAVTAEYAFVWSFFGGRRAADQMIPTIFGPSYAVIASARTTANAPPPPSKPKRGRAAAAAAETEAQFADATDLIGTLLCACAVRLQEREMQRRAVPALEPFFDDARMAFWPVFKRSLDAQIASLAPDVSGRAAARGVSHTAPAIGGHGALSSSVTAGLAVSVRVGALSAALSVVLAVADEPFLAASLSDLRRAYTIFESQAVGDVTPRERAGYMLSLRSASLAAARGASSLAVAALAGAMTDDQAAADRLSVLSAVEDLTRDVAELQAAFIEAELYHYFAKVLTVVRRCSAGEAGETDDLVEDLVGAVDRATVEDAAAGFLAMWRGALDRLKGDCQRLLASRELASEVFRESVSEFLQRYVRFLEICRAHSVPGVVATQDIYRDVAQLERGSY
jgi:hypothetical protein